MTTFGWDDSHYGEPPRARDGIDLYTHKLTDGDHYYEDAEYKIAMEAARALGIPILGPYHVLHGRRSIERQALWLVERATKLTPWWQDWPDWTWQVDAERFSYFVAPTIDEVNAFGAEISRLTGSPLTAIPGYCPSWVYGENLRRLQLPWWQSNYGANPALPYRQAYPGDTSQRWNGPIPALMLQYGSNTIIAGQRTCDANAYRGTLSQLKAALKGTDDMASQLEKESAATAARVAAFATGTSSVETSWSELDPDGQELQWNVAKIREIVAQTIANGQGISELKQALAAQAVVLARIESKIDALGGGGSGGGASVEYTLTLTGKAVPEPATDQ